ncbi:hypothetical protein BCR39DRAFT_529151 [Naematelia encephala]|uniref:Matrin-type domain-containing protein n=1 Tax=Naematelia encephala TaxID=71784 RepID=A0A1Y2B7Z2_9TREE|nr:hypothetical protein BCR39DRAFT_529151 [Naematelia encephala]
MTEYWVSKKQYWCKYCNIFIRDDAPSRRQHETGLKHQGNKERFIRDLYKGGNQAKREREAEAIEMARIEASAARAHAKDVHLPSARPSLLTRLHSSATSSSKPRERSKPEDRFANYSTAAQLGFEDQDTQKSMYEVEQELKGRAGEVGAWQVVDYGPHGYSGETDTDAGGSSGKRKLGEYGAVVDEDTTNEEWKFEAGRKRIIKDPYDEDDWDPKALLKSSKGKDKITKQAEKSELSGQGLKRDGWSGKIELKVDNRATSPTKPETEGLVYIPNGGGWVKPDSQQGTAQGQGDVKPDIETSESKPLIDQHQDHETLHTNPNDTDGTSKTVIASTAESDSSIPAPPADSVSAATSSLFKKRRPPPASRKK